ncbi:MAG: tetracycline resistance MFS efflux pump [Promethearchaeota archaeon]
MKSRLFKHEELAPLWVAVFVDILGFSLVLPMLPFFARDYSASGLVVGLLLSSNAVFSFAFGPILAHLSDRFGRKPLLVVSQLGTLAGFLILAASDSLAALFAARIVDGVFGGQFPIAKATIGDVIPPEERPKQMTNIGVAFTLASLAGPSIGGLLAKFGTAGPGLAAAALSAVNVAFTSAKFRETLPLKTGLERPWHATFKAAPTHSVLSDGRVRYLLLLYAALAVQAATFQTSFSLFAIARFNAREVDVGLAYTAMGVFNVFFRGVVFGRMRNRLGDVKTSQSGLFGFVVAFATIGAWTELWQLAFVVVLVAFSGACSRGIIMGFASAVVDHRLQGKINGLTSAMDSLSQIVGPVVGNALVGAAWPHAYELLLALFAASTFSLSLGLPRLGVGRAPAGKGSTESNPPHPNANPKD